MKIVRAKSYVSFEPLTAISDFARLERKIDFRPGSGETIGLYYLTIDVGMMLPTERL